MKFAIWNAIRDDGIFCFSIFTENVFQMTDTLTANDKATITSSIDSSRKLDAIFTYIRSIDGILDREFGGSIASGNTPDNGQNESVGNEGEGKKGKNGGKLLDGIERVKRTLDDINSAIMKVTDAWVRMNATAYETARSLGVASENFQSFQRNMVQNQLDFGIKWGATTKEMMDIQSQYSDSVKRNATLNDQQLETMLAISRLGGEAGRQVVAELDQYGMGMTESSLQFAAIQYRSQAYGLNAKNATNSFKENIKLAASYTFRGGVDGINRMTILSETLKFNMQSIASVADKMSTVEGAIETSAKLQMLGGTFAQQFSNPIQMLYESLNDMEGLTNRVVNSVAGKVSFDRRTGEFKPTAYAQQEMKYAAEALGMSRDEFMRMAIQSRKQEEIGREINGRNDLTEEMKQFVKNQAEYTVDSGWVVTYLEDGETRTKKLNDITAQNIEAIRGGVVKDESIDENVQAIRQDLHRYLISKGLSATTYEEQQRGMKESTEALKAKASDWAMNWIKEGLASGNTSWLPYASVGLGIGTTALGFIQGHRVRKSWNPKGGGGTPATPTGGTTTTTTTSGGGEGGIKGRSNPKVTAKANGFGEGTEAVSKNGVKYRMKNGEWVNAKTGKAMPSQNVAQFEEGLAKNPTRVTKQVKPSPAGSTAENAAKNAITSNADDIARAGAKKTTLTYGEKVAGNFAKYGKAMGVLGGVALAADIGLGITERRAENGKMSAENARDWKKGGDYNIAAHTATGALNGASIGAVVGSVIPVIGTAVGGAVGAVVGGVNGYLKSSKERRHAKQDRQINEGIFYEYMISAFESGNGALSVFPVTQVQASVVSEGGNVSNTPIPVYVVGGQNAAQVNRVNVGGRIDVNVTGSGGFTEQQKREISDYVINRLNREMNNTVGAGSTGAIYR